MKKWSTGYLIKKEMILIADLMVNELVKMPDNSYISMMELFQIADTEKNTNFAFLKTNIK